MAPAVLFDNVSKKFRRGERHNSLRDLLPAVARRLVGRNGDTALGNEEFWAVRDVSFTVDPGEGFAIIGPNGAGKSTILKLLTKILRPNLGSCAVRGRTGALIEVAAGFHPELTGRENIFLQGAIMGMNRHEIMARFNDIVQFAGLDLFVDTPVKRYSSGMNARLGFSIAAHLNPDVLIIDEILSVGDQEFQQRCIERMHAFKAAGAAVVFVSHNLQAVATYFDRGLLLERGQCRFAGTALETVEAYTRARVAAPGSQTRGTRAWIVGAKLLSAAGTVISEAVPGDRLTLLVTFAYSGERAAELVFGFFVTEATTGRRLYHSTAKELGQQWTLGDGPGEVTAEFAFRVNLLKGTYYVNTYIADSRTYEGLDKLEPAAHLTVYEAFSLQGSTDLEVECRRVLQVGQEEASTRH